MVPTIHMKGEGYMTIKDLIQKVKEERPNSFSDAKVISFINEVEKDVAEQLRVSVAPYTGFYFLPEVQPTADTWNNGEGWYAFIDDQYVEQTGQTRNPQQTYYLQVELLAPAPYDRLYVSYVKSQIAFANEEMANYQNDVAQHTQDFRDYVDWVVSTNQVVENPFPTKLIHIM